MAAPVAAQFTARCASLIADLGLGHEIGVVTPLTGGVASDIARVDLPGGPVCVKFALPKLKVAAEWFAPVHRNRAEYHWLGAAGLVAPGAVPKLYGRSEKLNGFAMEYLEGEGIYLWKAALLAGKPPQGEAQQVASILGRLHAHSTTAGFDASPFQNHEDFRAIRLEPYLLHTASLHRDVAPRLLALSDQLYRSSKALVHGDISPKNILIREGKPVLLDAECATMGDPVFDVAFCLNHLLLKSVHLPASSGALLQEAADFWQAYATHVTWEPLAGLDTRLAALLPALMLARIDGKSPVEYLDHAARNEVRSLSLDLLREPPQSLAELLSRLTHGKHSI